MKDEKPDRVSGSIGFYFANHQLPTTNC